MNTGICPHCHKEIPVYDGYTRCLCAECHQEVDIPEALKLKGDLATNIPESETANESPECTSLLESVQDVNNLICPQCGGNPELRIDVTPGWSRAVCPLCGEQIEVPDGYKWCMCSACHQQIDIAQAKGQVDQGETVEVEGNPTSDIDSAENANTADEQLAEHAPDEVVSDTLQDDASEQECAAEAADAEEAADATETTEVAPKKKIPYFRIILIVALVFVGLFGQGAVLARFLCFLAAFGMGYIIYLESKGKINTDKK